MPSRSSVGQLSGQYQYAAIAQIFLYLISSAARTTKSQTIRKYYLYIYYTENTIVLPLALLNAHVEIDAPARVSVNARPFQTLRLRTTWNGKWNKNKITHI